MCCLLPCTASLLVCHVILMWALQIGRPSTMSPSFAACVASMHAQVYQQAVVCINSRSGLMALQLCWPSLLLRRAALCFVAVTVWHSLAVAPFGDCASITSSSHCAPFLCVPMQDLRMSCTCSHLSCVGMAGLPPCCQVRFSCKSCAAFCIVACVWQTV
jgi:hypothetical protein